MGIFQAISESAKRYPRCRIANCECDSFGDEWGTGCGCLCHLLQLQKQVGQEVDLVEFGEYQDLDEFGRKYWIAAHRPCDACRSKEFNDDGFCKRCGQEK